MYENLTKVELPTYDEDDLEFAKEIRSTLSRGGY